MGKNTRFTLDMSSELHTRLKIIAAIKGVTMRDYCLSAIEIQLIRDRVGVTDGTSVLALEPSKAPENPRPKSRAAFLGGADVK